MGFEQGWWRYQVAALIGHTAGKSILFFFHALVALLLTERLLRRRTGFDRTNVLRRAIRGTGLLTCGAAVVFAAAFVVDDVLPATRFLRFDFTAAATLAVWFGGTALLLPARVMGHEPATSSGLLRTTFIVALVLVPWFLVSELAGRPMRHCHECFGLFEGGIVSIPLLGAYLLGLTVSSAAVSAAACMPARAQAAPGHPPSHRRDIPCRTDNPVCSHCAKKDRQDCLSFTMRGVIHVSSRAQSRDPLLDPTSMAHAAEISRLH